MKQWASKKRMYENTISSQCKGDPYFLDAGIIQK